MSIIIFFLLGLGSLGIAIYSLVIGAEWWVGVIFIGFSIGLIIYSLYKLNDETGCFEGALKKIDEKNEKRKRKKERHSKQIKVNMVKTFIWAYDLQKSIPKAEFIEKTVSRLYKSYTMFNETNKRAFEKDGKEYDGKSSFFAYECLIAALILSNDKIEEGEYEVYTGFCKIVGFEPMPRNKIIGFSDELFDELKDSSEDTRLVRILGGFHAFRSQTPPSAFSALISGLACLSVVDGVVAENEYDIVSALLEKGFDTVPSTWEQFKREY